MEKINIGKSDLTVSPLGIGVMAWGADQFWGYGDELHRSDVEKAFHVCLDAGINFFDTAEIYGRGGSEKNLGGLIKDSDEPVVVATKFAPQPSRFFGTRLGKLFNIGLRTKGLSPLLSRGLKSFLRGPIVTRGLTRSLNASLDRLGLEQVDLYQIHYPVGWLAIEALMDSLAKVVETGKVHYVGVSNFNAEQMRRAHAALQRRGLPLISNQVKYSLIHRQPEKNGLLATCIELGITLIAHSPLGQGALTGNYLPDISPMDRFRKNRKQFTRDFLVRLQPLINTMEEIGDKYGGRSLSQVALNWLLRQENVLPIPGVKDEFQARDNAAALDWEMTKAQAARLASLSDGLS